MRGAVWLLWLASAAVRAGDQDDSAALALSAVPVLAASATRPVAMTAEASATIRTQRDGEQNQVQSLSLDARYDKRLTADWRVVWAARLDSAWASRFDANQQIGTWKETYLSWQPGPTLLLDGGRINTRQGVAYGYNPTDFFRAGAVRSVVSLDPDSLRENRLGTVMLRAQKLWDSGSLTIQYAPRLQDHASAAPLDPDIGATNSQGRWLLSVSQRLAAGWTPQWLLFGADGQSPQLGMNLTAALGQSVVTYLEIAGGRSTSQWAHAIGGGDDKAFRSRTATGLTWSAANKLSLTFEYQYNGAGPSSAQWAAARSGDGVAYARYRALTQSLQELPTRSNAFLYASWQDLVLRHLDLSAFLRRDLADRSQLSWTQLRYHWTRIDMALRWQHANGDATSHFGASSERQSWQLLWDCYL